MTSTYSIKDLSQLTKIKPHTLRIWEQRYGMMKPERSGTNIRKYSQDDLKYLLNVSILYDNGLKISNIAKLSNAELADEVRDLASKSIPYPSQIRGLVLAMMELDEDRFEKQVSNHILSYGLEDTMIHILFPFLQHVGILWVTNTIGPAKEHFVSNLIRQKLIVAIDGLQTQLCQEFKKFILYLPEGELHEIGLLYSAFLIKSRGHKVIYLGQSLPLIDLFTVQDSMKADVIVTIITSNPCAKDVAPYLAKIRESIPNTQIWLGGRQVADAQPDLSQNFIFLDGAVGLRNILDKAPG